MTDPVAGVRTVVFEVDTRAYLDSEEQLDSVVRELQLHALAGRGRHTPVGEVSARLLPEIQRFMKGFAHIRLNNRVQAQTAARHREPTVRLQMALRPAAAVVAAEFLRLLEEVDGYWREWGLLAWSQTAETRELRQRMLEAIVTQVELADSER